MGSNILFQPLHTSTPDFFFFFNFTASSRPLRTKAEGSPAFWLESPPWP